MHILTPKTYQEDYPGFYRTFLSYLQDKNGYLTLNTTHNDINITVQTRFIEDFNQSAKSYMTDILIIILKSGVLMAKFIIVKLITKVIM